MNYVFECTERTEIGLFGIEKGSRWKICGFEYCDPPQKSKVRICEMNVFSDDVWVEIPQSLFALNFKQEVCD